MAGDPFWANVKYLNHFDGVDGSRVAYNESSLSAHLCSFTGSTSELSTLQKLYGTTSYYAPDGSHSGLVTADSTDFDFGSGAFTVEVAFRPDSLTIPQTLVAKWNTTGNQRSWIFNVSSSGELHTWISTNGSNFIEFEVAGGMSVGTWYVLCFERDASGVMRLYRDGTFLAKKTDTSTFYNSTSDFRIGDRSTGDWDIRGFIDECRITKGVARYASDSGYTIATEAFPDGPISAVPRIIINTL